MGSTGGKLLGNWCRIQNNIPGLTKEAVKLSSASYCGGEKLYLNPMKKIKCFLDLVLQRLNRQQKPPMLSRK